MKFVGPVEIRRYDMKLKRKELSNLKKKLLTTKDTEEEKSLLFKIDSLIESLHQDGEKEKSIKELENQSREYKTNYPDGFHSFGEQLQAVAKANSGKGCDKRLISNRGMCMGA